MYDERYGDSDVKEGMAEEGEPLLPRGLGVDVRGGAEDDAAGAGAGAAIGGAAVGGAAAVSRAWRALLLLLSFPEMAPSSPKSSRRVAAALLFRPEEDEDEALPLLPVGETSAVEAVMLYLLCFRRECRSQYWVNQGGIWI